MRAVLREIKELVARNEEVHFRRRLGVRRHLEFEFDAVDDALVAGRHDQVGGTHQLDRARRSIAGPAMMFSDTACSMNRLGAMIATRPEARVSSSSTPHAPP